ncbi:MAG TPA: ABC-F family ATP-binding cassette domain-containing protein, partial [Phycisphaerales bacterium]|nr:ABC-F family ATP-binding cassette domain-containing protein [Phycisphaerales bacterium]
MHLTRNTVALLEGEMEGRERRAGSPSHEERREERRAGSPSHRGEGDGEETGGTPVPPRGRRMERRAGSPSHRDREEKRREERRKPLTPALSPRGGEREDGFGTLGAGGESDASQAQRRRLSDSRARPNKLDRGAAMGCLLWLGAENALASARTSFPMTSPFGRSTISRTNPSTLGPMPVLAATNIELAYGDRRILDGVSLTLEPGERAGLVGRNGSGKSSLLKVIAGTLRPDAGTVTLTGGARAGYLAQEPELDGTRTLREEAAAAFSHIEQLESELHDVFHAMADAEGEALDKLLRRQESLEKRIEAAGGLATDHKVDTVLHGLGFRDDQFGVPVTGLSGGQRARLALAKLLLGEPEVLLLDEPTNHLDIAGRLWLEDFIENEYRGAVLMISHDRYLLDNVVTRIIEVDPVPNLGGRLLEYPGNYAAFRRLRAERIEAQRRAWENQQTKFRQQEA